MAEPEFDEEVGGLQEVVSQQDMVEQARVGDVDEDYGTRARRISKMSRERALERLQSGYDKLAAQKTDDRDRWLAVAGAMLAPTKTGGFGESLGAAATALTAQRKEDREFLSDRAQRLAEMEESMADVEQEFAEREIDILGEEQDRVTGRRKAWQPRLYMDENSGEIYEAIQGKDAEGVLQTDWTVQAPPEGAKLTPLTNLSPELQLQLSQARKGGGIEAEAIDLAATNARQARLDLADAYYGLTLLQELKEAGGTGGFQKKLNQVRSWLGSDAKDVTDRNVLMNIFGAQLIEKLGAFGYNPSQKDLEIAQQLSADIAQPGATNEQILHDWVRKLEQGLRVDMYTVNKYGNDRQKMMISGKLLNKGIAEPLLEYARGKGFEFEEFDPFPTQEAPAIPSRQTGDAGLIATPHTFTNAAEFNRIMSDPEEMKKMDIRPGDYVLVPGEEHPRKVPGG